MTPDTFRYFDAHTHAHFSAFKDDYREVIRRALDAGVGLINVGTQKDTSRRAVEVAHEFESEPVYPHTRARNGNTIGAERRSSFGAGVYAAVGLHPIHTSKSYHDPQELGASPSTSSGFISRDEEFDFEYYKKLARDPKVVAIGECGLDYYRFEGDVEELKKKQKKAFEMQIELSKETAKPLMIHCRDAFRDTLDILKAVGGRAGVAHSFVRTVDEARELLDLGFYFTFAGNITFKPRADKPSADEVIRFIPADRLLSETDAPYLAPAPYRGKRNEPAYIIEVVKRLAELKGITVDEMAAQIIENAKRIFGI